MSLNENEILNVVASVHESLRNLDIKRNQLNKLKQFIVQVEKGEIANEQTMSVCERDSLINKLKVDIANMDLLLDNHHDKIKNICEMYNLNLAFETAKILNNWVK
jgi:hypothetical protein